MLMQVPSWFKSAAHWVAGMLIACLLLASGLFACFTDTPAVMKTTIGVLGIALSTVLGLLCYLLRFWLKEMKQSHIGFDTKGRIVRAGPYLHTSNEQLLTVRIEGMGFWANTKFGSFEVSVDVSEYELEKLVEKLLARGVPQCKAQLADERFLVTVVKEALEQALNDIQDENPTERRERFYRTMLATATELNGVWGVRLNYSHSLLNLEFCDASETTDNDANREPELAGSGIS